MSAGYPDGSGPVHAAPTYFKATATPRSAPVGTADRPIPLIIDSDPAVSYTHLTLPTIYSV